MKYRRGTKLRYRNTVGGNPMVVTGWNDRLQEYTLQEGSSVWIAREHEVELFREFDMPDLVKELVEM